MDSNVPYSSTAQSMSHICELLTCHLRDRSVCAAYAPLPYAFAHLGWPAGIIFLGLAGLVTWYTSLLLASLDRHDGHRHVRYCDLAGSIYGETLKVIITLHVPRRYMTHHSEAVF